jgi:hypothetical protein
MNLKIKVGKNPFFNCFKESKSRKDYSCYNCNELIPKGSIKYNTRDGHCHISCAKLYKEVLRKISHEYESEERFRSEWILLTEF